MGKGTGKGAGAANEHIDNATAIAEALLATLNGLKFPDISTKSALAPKATDVASAQTAALNAENRALKARLPTLQNQIAVLQANAAKAQAAGDSDQEARDTAEKNLAKLKAVEDALAAVLAKARKALFSRETELTRENAKLLAINIKLGGTGALPDSIVPFKSVITIANTRPHTQLELLTEIAAVEASNANLHALNTALTVENHLLKKHQDANREQGDELQRAKARAEADRKARAEAEREADGARKAREEADRRAKAAARDNSKAAADAAAAAAATLRAREAAVKTKEDAEARRRAVEGATSSPKRSPKLKKKNRKRANLVDGFYQLPSDKTRRFVRVVGDQVMVRGGGGFYSLEKWIEGHVKLHGTTVKQRKQHLAVLVKEYKDALHGESGGLTTELPSHYYKNFTEHGDAATARREEITEVMGGRPRRESLLSHLIDIPIEACPKDQKRIRRQSLTSSHGSYLSLDLADGLPFNPSAKMPHGAVLARANSDDGVGRITSLGWEHVQSNLPSLRRSLSMSADVGGAHKRGSLLDDIPEGGEAHVFY